MSRRSRRIRASYEHIDPALVGNRRHIVVSDQAGRANILARLREIGLAVEADASEARRAGREVKAREFEGYAYDGAEASFELLARRMLGGVPEYFRLQRFRVMDERRWNARGELVTVSEATIKVRGGGDRADDGRRRATARSNALDTALRKALMPAFPELARHAPHRLQGAHPDAAGRHGGGDARDDRKRATRAARAGRRSASRPTSSTPRTTRCTTPDL